MVAGAAVLGVPGVVAVVVVASAVVVAAEPAGVPSREEYPGVVNPMPPGVGAMVGVAVAVVVVALVGGGEAILASVGAPVTISSTGASEFTVGETVASGSSLCPP